MAGDVGVGAAVACAVRVSPHAVDATFVPVLISTPAVTAVARLRDVPGHEPRAARQVRLDEEPPQEGHAVLAGRLGPELLALAHERRLRRAAAVRDPQIGPGLVDAAEERARYFCHGHGVRRRRAAQVRLAICRVHIVRDGAHVEVRPEAADGEARRALVGVDAFETQKINARIRADLEQQLEAAADWLQQSGILNGLPQLPPVAFYPAATGALPPVPSDGLAGTRIAIARDVAFSFIYDANVLTLQQLGAEVLFFSPLNETAVPQADALWLPGGYPELHAEALAANVSMTQSMRDFVASGKPVLAECGGFLYCLQGLTDLQGKRTPMLGVLPGEGRMRDRGGCQGMQSAPLPEGEIRGHAHHRSMSENTPAPLAYGRRQRHPAPGEAIYRQGSLTATYLHLFFSSNPQAVARLFKPDGQH